MKIFSMTGAKAKPRYLTKSRFKLAIECPTKLFYTGKPEIYANKKLDDPFLAALARGGFQVGELAKAYFPGGVEVESLDYDEAIAKTKELLQRENVIIFEAALQVENLFIRVDVLQKNGDHIDIIEVKSKSYDPENPEGFSKQNGELRANWVQYFYDVAFQTHVAKKYFKSSNVSPFLMLADKSVGAPSSGLNQKFLLVKKDNRTRCVQTQELTREDLAKRLLTLIDVDQEVQKILNTKNESGFSFDEQVKAFADAYEKDERIAPRVGMACKKCEFDISKTETNLSLKSGRRECWQEALRLKKEDWDRPKVFELWDFRSCHKSMAAGKFFLDELDETDIQLKIDNKPGLSRTERQLLQIKKTKAKDNEAFIDRKSLEAEMKTWKFPLHFIDFETTAVALPFHEGARPYEGVAFQFSHHVVDANGHVAHQGEYLHTTVGEFPSFHFLRALKKELEQDEGSIFRYSHHENTYLNFILNQLERSDEPDRAELQSFLKTITRSKKDAKEQWVGERDMIDLCQMVKRYFYHPRQCGSNSLKYVLPAALNASIFLKEKYSKPIYGAANGIRSLNFKDYAWVKQDEAGEVIDPYRQLPKIFENCSADEIDLLFDEDELANGGAAMTAWAQMQFTEMSPQEREAIATALKKYCELDTLAMVMLYEYWRESLDD